MRKRPVLFATLAVVLLGAAGATSVYFVGSKQRRDDRAAYLAYERALLPSLEEVRRNVTEFRRVRENTRFDLISIWLLKIQRSQDRALAASPPTFMRDVRAALEASLDAYAQGCRAISRSRRVEDGADELARADALFERAARPMQFHRRRLGLGPTPALPDPAATAAG